MRPILHCLWQMTLGGAERSVFKLASAQRAAGLDVAILTGSKPEGYFADLLAKTDIPLYGLSMRHGFDMVTAMRNLKTLPKKPWLMHFHCAEVGMFLPVFMARRGCRFVYTHRGGQRGYSTRKKVRHFLWGRCLRFFFDGKIAISPSARKALARIMAADRGITVIPNALDPSHFQVTRPREEVRREIGLPEQAFVVGTSANVRRWKRIERLLDALAGLEDETVHGVIIGWGQDLEYYKGYAAGKGLADRVHFTGKKTDIANYLQVLDVFAMTSGREEGFGNAPIEAMYLGIPTVIYADLESLVEYLEDGREVRVIGERQSLGEVLTALRDDHALQEQLSQAGPGVIEKFSVDKLLNAHLQFYKSLT